MNGMNFGNYTIRILACGHQHVLLRDMDLKDFKCPTRVKAILPCGHETIQKPCHIDVNEWRCEFPCDARIEPCGHSCVRTCHVNYDPDHIEYRCSKICNRVLQGCSTKKHLCQKHCYQTCRPCKAIVLKKLPNCNHRQALECSDSGYEIVCKESCTKKIAECGHDCKLKCYEPCGSCDEMVLKTLSSCGHKVWTKCSKLPDVQNCQGSCPKSLRCGHLCKNKCNEVCTNVCLELVDHTIPVFCGHKFKIECHMQTKEWLNFSDKLLRFCKEPCTTVLDCMHKCSGTCGECFQGRIHVTCMKKCGAELVCGHECKIPCREVCQPCSMTCGMRCSHNKCNKKCGDVCTECQELCTRQCKHIKCTAKCGDICTVPPCQEPCEKKLQCSHPCVGFCGDPCPPLCRICNADTLTEVFLGFEDEIDSRFVLLVDCNHVIESKGMEIYCEQEVEGGHKGIKYRRCPKCRTPITSTQRYSDYVKQAIKDIAAIKKKNIGDLAEIEKKRKKLQNKLNAIHALREARVFLTSNGIDEFVKKCDSLLQPVHENRRQMFDLMIGKTLEAKLTIVQNIGNILKTQQLNVPRGSNLSSNVVFLEASTYVDYLFNRLTKQVERITNQEIQDFKRELDRLHRIAQFVKITEGSPSGDYRDMRKLIYRPTIYTGDFDKCVTAKLKELRKKSALLDG